MRLPPWRSAAAREMRRIIAVRSARVGSAALVAQAVLYAALPRHLYPVFGFALAVSITAALSCDLLATFCPGIAFPGEERALSHLPKEVGRVIALTFDDGPFSETTPQLLDWLATANVKATFFLIAERVREHPELARRIAAEGHALGVHGLRHRSMALMSAARCETELREARRILEDAIGLPLPYRLFRPPYGFRSRALIRAAKRNGWRICGWSNDPHDYDPPRRKTTPHSLRNGDIVLLHETPAPRLAEDDPQDAILALVRRDSFSCVTLADIRQS